MHIRQRGPSDCGVAAVAMFTGKTYEEALIAGLETGQFHPKSGMSSCGFVLEALGYHWENLGRHPDRPAPNPDGPQFQSMTLIRWASGVLHPKVHGSSYGAAARCCRSCR
jgi:hypothetical protein